MSSAIEKIGKRTKQIRKGHPGMSFRSAQQKASAEYRAGKLGAVRKKSAPKKKAAKKKAAKKKSLKRSRSRSHVGAVNNGADRLDNKRVNITVGSISSQQARLKKTIAEKIGWYEAALMSAKTVKAEKNLKKKIAALKLQYRKLD